MTDQKDERIAEQFIPWGLRYVDQLTARIAELEQQNKELQAKLAVEADLHERWRTGKIYGSETDRLRVEAGNLRIQRDELQKRNVELVADAYEEDEDIRNALRPILGDKCERDEHGGICASTAVGMAVRALQQQLDEAKKENKRLMQCMNEKDDAFMRTEVGQVIAERDAALLDYEGRKASEEASVAECNRLLSENSALRASLDEAKSQIERDNHMRVECGELRDGLERCEAQLDAERAKVREMEAALKEISDCRGKIVRTFEFSGHNYDEGCVRAFGQAADIADAALATPQPVNDALVQGICDICGSNGKLTEVKQHGIAGLMVCEKCDRPNDALAQGKEGTP